MGIVANLQSALITCIRTQGRPWAEACRAFSPFCPYPCILAKKSFTLVVNVNPKSKRCSLLSQLSSTLLILVVIFSFFLTTASCPFSAFCRIAWGIGGWARIALARRNFSCRPVKVFVWPSQSCLLRVPDGSFGGAKRFVRVGRRIRLAGQSKFSGDVIKQMSLIVSGLRQRAQKSRFSVQTSFANEKRGKTTRLYTVNS